MPVEALAHINLRTPLIDETVAFYEAALGLRRGPAATMTDQVNNAWLHDAAGRPLIHINSPLDGEIARPPITPGRLDHVAFDCTDLGGTAERLRAAGVVFVETSLPGLTQINLYDPNGLKVELTFHDAAR